jgi:hypothetical protein
MKNSDVPEHFRNKGFRFPVFSIPGLYFALSVSCAGTTRNEETSKAVSEPAPIVNAPTTAIHEASAVQQSDSIQTVKMLIREPNRVNAMMDIDFLRLLIRADGGDPKAIDFAAGLRDVIEAKPLDCDLWFEEEEGYTAIAIHPPMSDQSPEQCALITAAIDGLKAGREVMVYCRQNIRYEECEEIDEAGGDIADSENAGDTAELSVQPTCEVYENEMDNLLFGVNLFRGRIRAWMVSENSGAKLSDINPAK